MAGCFRCWVVLLLVVAEAARADTFGLVARVDGQEITAKRFEHYFEDFLSDRGRNIASIRNPDALRKLRSEALNALIDEELLWQEAARKGMSASPQEIDAAFERMRSSFRTPDAFARRLERAGFDEAGYRDYLGQQLAVKRLVEERIQAGITVSDAEARRYYRNNPARFAIPEQLRLRHIAIATGQDPEGARSRCARLLMQARLPKADFAALAKSHSEDASAANGGDLGYVATGQLPPVLQQAVAGLKPGQVSDVVDSEFGCHILKLEKRRSGRLPEAEARDTARSYVKAEKSRQALQKHLESLRRRARVEVLMSP